MFQFYIFNTDYIAYIVFFLNLRNDISILTLKNLFYFLEAQT